jgi:hypothetical protein
VVIRFIYVEYEVIYALLSRIPFLNNALNLWNLQCAWIEFVLPYVPIRRTLDVLCLEVEWFIRPLILYGPLCRGERGEGVLKPTHQPPAVRMSISCVTDSNVRGGGVLKPTHQPPAVRMSIICVADSKCQGEGVSFSSLPTSLLL